MIFRNGVMNIKTPVSWMGNKTSVLHILYALFPLNYERYIEPFGGSGAVLLGKKKPDKFEVLIKHYDRENTFFYCDPPYYSSEYVYQCGFTWEDHLRLKNTLTNSKGKWLVSYNDCEEIRNLYDGYSFFDFTRLHNMKQRTNAGEQFPELLISNYDMY